MIKAEISRIQNKSTAESFDISRVVLPKRLINLTDLWWDWSRKKENVTKMQEWKGNIT